MRTILKFAAVVSALSTAIAFAATPKPVKPTQPQLMYLGTWPHTIRVIDINTEKVVDTIELPTDIARSLILSPDKTKLYASSLRDNSIVTIDLKTRKVLDSFTLNTPEDQNRIGGLAVDPTGKLMYSIMTTYTKKIDHYEVAEPKWVEINLEQKKVTRSVPVPAGEQAAAGGLGGRAPMRVSPDGKSIYIVRQNIQIYNTSDFKLAKTIDLASAAAPPGTETLSLNLMDDPNAPPGRILGIFNSTDPYVHRAVFGLADIDLFNGDYQLTPIGPSEGSIQPMLLTPDRKMGYTVATSGTHGDRVTEFWAFDIDNKKIVARKEFTGRTRLANFGMSADGKKLLIYNAGFEIEVYDTKTMTLEKSINLGGDTTSNLIVMPYHP